MRVLSGVAQGAVGLPLEGGEVIEGRGFLELFTPLHLLSNLDYYIKDSLRAEMNKP